MSELPTEVKRRTFDGRSRLATQGERVYGEPTDDGWRAWDPSRSKVGAMLELGMDTGLGSHETVLYLGAASGTTVSHVADISGPTYAIEFAARPTRDLLDVAESRPNLIPLLKDARRPDTYAHIVEPVDLLIQDVATRGQAEVAITNARFLSPGGRLLLVIKARSEDVTADPVDVYDSATETLDPHYEILETSRLDRYHSDHLGVAARLPVE